MQLAVLGCRMGQSLALWNALWHTKWHIALWQLPQFQRMHALMVEKVDFFLRVCVRVWWWPLRASVLCKGGEPGVWFSAVPL